jgi:hypothetical protein
MPEVILPDKKQKKSYEQRAAEKDAEAYKRELETKRRDSFVKRGNEAQQIRTQMQQAYTTQSIE